ncbi:hypothetical protein V500_06040 [Pseudogymnoascus sp. VKM F-4518 (FW-2643)]|nr:hypothetical protein V500_06040 [Pseudogymnoascus sp. VKM F-4518 (FW-2643)]
MHRILQQLPQDPPQRLARARLGDHILPLDRASEGCNRADLGAYQALDLGEDRRGGRGGGGVSGRGERDECEGEVALEGVGDADDAAFGDEGGGGDGLFDCSCVC